MTRRSFISDLLKCGIATTFLPGAGRIWKPTYQPTFELVPFGEMVQTATRANPELNLKELIACLYQLKRELEKMGYANHIDIWCGRKHLSELLGITPPPVEFTSDGLPYERTIKGIYEQLRSA